MHLKFEFEKINQDNIEQWKAYFDAEAAVLNNVQDFYGTLCDLINGNEPLNTKTLTQPGKMQEAFDRCHKDPNLCGIFGVEAFLSLDLFEKALIFLLNTMYRKGPPNRFGWPTLSIGSFSDPIYNSKDSLKLIYPYPKGLWIANAKYNNETVISVMVFPTPNRKAQVHQFIFKSIRFLAKEALGIYEPIRELSMPLHMFAANELNCSFIVVRPIRKMKKILELNDFQIFPDEQCAQKFLGKDTYNYLIHYGTEETNTHGEHDLLYYCENNPALHARFLAKKQKQRLLEDLLPRFKEPSAACVKCNDENPNSALFCQLCHSILKNFPHFLGHLDQIMPPLEAAAAGPGAHPAQAHSLFRPLNPSNSVQNDDYTNDNFNHSSKPKP